MKFSGMAVFLSLWSLVVYCPMAHMVWGAGGLLNANGGRIPSLDFCRGTVVHITSGVSALITALYLGKRIGYPKTAMPPHSLVLSFIGACLLWVAGSALTPARQRMPARWQRVPLSTRTLRRRRRRWLDGGRVVPTRQADGAGRDLRLGSRLVAITPASGYVQPMSALAIGLIAGLFCCFMVLIVKGKLGYDDSLDAFGVHGMGGTLGALLTGVFAVAVINPALGTDASGKPLPLGGLDGHWAQLGNQAAGAGIAC